MTTEGVVKAESPEITPEKADKGERERSRIEFPYFSLDEATKIAKGVFELGSTCQIDQLAGHLNQSATGGGFRVKLMAARTFGLITYTQGSASLTDLGSKLFDPDTEREAKAEAFLKVPLYNAIYEQYKNKMLPGNVGLEGAMVNLGVAAKQKDKARQAFQRSAKEAGFFAYGTTKLVYPVLGTLERVAKEKGADIPLDTPKIHDKKTSNSGGTGGGDLHPFIQGLLKTLPEVATEWTQQGRQQWLQTAAGIFNLIYQASADDKGTIQVAIVVPKSVSDSAN
ncbi:hypothetical protein [Edaphobacter flagellatus]|uniref:hypothetical protein n=1 Tax=Edaphobacter flagellatus TaxID=1933044 RepID=UPI0021B23159|nr:hypothetical protein [Edaphobacter flagellatus]